MYIKGFNNDLTCRGFQFEVGKEYKIDHDRPIELCSDTVFHFCESLKSVHGFYKANEENRFCIIEALGEVVTDGEKFGSDHIRIVRELTQEEVAVMAGKVNGNTGLFCTGNWNTGDWNTGNRNTGYGNTGDWNTGDLNTGNRNTGHGNTGDLNTGNRNTGNRNTGYGNTGDLNTGNRNTGYWNTGDLNTGNRNTGDWNTGYWNAGYGNTGNWNTGDLNTGNRNTGYGNKSDFSTGVFCNEPDMSIRIFNRPSGMSMKDFLNSKYYDALSSVPLELIVFREYTAEEKAGDPGKEAAGGRLVERTPEEAWAEWWKKLTEENRDIVKQIPNFDADVFKDITGIEV